MPGLLSCQNAPQIALEGGSPAQQGASSTVDGRCGAVDSLHGLGDGGICWEFEADMQGGGAGFCDLLSMSEFLGIN